MNCISSATAACGGHCGPQVAPLHSRSWRHPHRCGYPAGLPAARTRLITQTAAAVKGSDVETTQSSSSSSNSSSSDSSTSSKSLLDPEYAKGLLDELSNTSQLGQRGEVLTVAQFAVFGLVLLPPFHSTALINLVGVLLLSGGAAAMGFALQELGTSLTPLPAPRKDASLVTSGVYGYLRHPMYGGLLMASLGLAAVTHDETRLLLAAVLWLVLEQKVAFEEGLLVQRYGQNYEKYRETVKKFIPYLY